MPDLDVLRDLGDRISPPDLELLRQTARRRTHRAAVATLGAGLAAVIAVTAGAVALTNLDDDRTSPDPIETPTPIPTPAPTPGPTPDAEPAHQSNTSMTPREVVQAQHAELAFAGASADDPNFRVAVWTAECRWCPYEFPDSQSRPYFNAMAVTADGWRTATYRRPPMGAGRPFRVLSPAPGALLVTDRSNGGEWLVYEDGSSTVVDRVVEDRPADEPRLWFECLSTEVQPPDYLGTWCALDVDSATAYEWRSPWSEVPGQTISLADPGTASEAWGRELMSVTGDRQNVAWFYRDGARQTRVLATAPPGSGGGGFTSDAVLGAREDLLYWSHVTGSGVLTFHVGDDGGDSWRDVEQSLPSSDVSTEELVATPAGAVLLRHITYRGEEMRARIWRLESLEEGEWELVHDTGALPAGADVGAMAQPTVIGTGLVWGWLSSADDGRTWTQTTTWR